MTKRAGKNKRRREGRSRDTTGKPNGQSGSQDTTTQRTLETPADISLWNEVRRHPEFVLSPEVFKKVGRDLYALAQDKKLKPGERIRAISEIRKLHESNRSRQNFEFSVHKHYQSRHSHAETPEADTEDSADTTAIAYREAVTLEESTEVLHELKQLGLMGVLLGAADERAD